MRRLLALAAIATLAFTAACNSSGGPTVSPTSPSPGFSAGPTGATGGAVVSGTVTVASGARALSASPAASPSLTVSVVGTAISGAVGSNGDFSLQGVPPGDVQLRISGSGVDATVTLSGIQAGQKIQIKITVAGSQGTIDSDSRESDGQSGQSEKQVEGRIESVVVPDTLIVAGQTVKVVTGTTIRKGDRTLTFADLVVGLRVHVKGVAASVVSATPAPAVIEAREITVQNENTDVPMKVTGKVLAAPSGSCPAITFELEGKAITVATDAATNFKPGCGSIQAGVEVEVQGRLQNRALDEIPTAGSSILASKVEIVGATGQKEVELTGTASSVAGSCAGKDVSFSVAGKQVQTNAATSFEPSCAVVINGAKVEVKGYMQGSSVVAVSVKVETESSGSGEVEVSGSISGLSVSACPSVTFTAGGKTIKADKSTSFQPSCNALKNGDGVRVKGKAQSDASILASKIERK